MESELLLGFDIGGTKSSVVLATRGGEILDRAGGPTEAAGGPSATIGRLLAGARQLIERNRVPLDRILGAGICCGGPLDREEGVVYRPPNLPGWDRVPVRKMVEDALGLPAALENDADCCALAESFFGAGIGRKNIVAFTWGTGIGAGIVLDGRLHSGSEGLAGEIGHITYITDGRLCQCGKRGCIEAYASGSSIMRVARERLEEGRLSRLAEMTPVDAQAVCDAAREGDELASEILLDAARAMGRAVSIAAHTLNPEIIVLGTLAVKAGDMLMPELLHVVETEVWERIRRSLAVIPSPLGDRVQDLAAISAFLGRL